MQEEKRAPLSMATGFSVFVLLCLLSMVGVVAIAAGFHAYSSIQANAQENSSTRNVIQYMMNKFRAAGGVSNFTIMHESSGDTLCLFSEIDGEMYETRIFCQDGMLREQFCEAGSERADGEPIANADTLKITEGIPYQITIALPNGKTVSCSVSIPVLEGQP